VPTSLRILRFIFFGGGFVRPEDLIKPDLLSEVLPSEYSGARCSRTRYPYVGLRIEQQKLIDHSPCPMTDNLRFLYESEIIPLQ
jgi:hypothetical protein